MTVARPASANDRASVALTLLALVFIGLLLLSA